MTNFWPANRTKAKENFWQQRRQKTERARARFLRHQNCTDSVGTMLRPERSRDEERQRRAAVRPPRGTQRSWSAMRAGRRGPQRPASEPSPQPKPANRQIDCKRRSHIDSPVRASLGLFVCEQWRPPRQRHHSLLAPCVDWLLAVRLRRRRAQRELEGQVRGCDRRRRG